MRFFHSLAETETLLKTAAHPRYQLEIGLVKLMEMRRLEPLNQLLERLAALEESVRTGKAPAGNSGTVKGVASIASAGTKPAAASASRSTSASSASSSPTGPAETPGMSKTAANSGAAAGSYSAAATQTALAHETSSSAGLSEADAAPASEIEQIKAALGDRRKMLLVTALDAARQADIEGNELCLEFAPETRHFRDTLAKSDNVKILREVCKETTGRDLGVRFVIVEPQASASATADAPPSKEESERRDKQSLREQAENNPTVQQMLKTFRGEIVDVKRVEPAK